MELFAKIANDFKLLTIFSYRSILDVRQCSEYVSEIWNTAYKCIGGWANIWIFNEKYQVQSLQKRQHAGMFWNIVITKT